MLQRCYNRKNPNYKNYGARGIAVCRRWRLSSRAYIEDMGQPPFEGAQVDRIDNDGDYEPGNCKWSTPQENCNNRRNTTMLTLDGETKSARAWSDQLGISMMNISLRLSLRGWTDEMILTTPVRTHKRKPIMKKISVEMVPLNGEGITVTVSNKAETRAAYQERALRTYADMGIALRLHDKEWNKEGTMTHMVMHTILVDLHGEDYATKFLVAS